ncbi:MAG: GAF domain-containing protein [Deltaproteobacteria bacterium]|nr:GAF domain-containing protein [Deltaproteobacteria bacterium]
MTTTELEGLVHAILTCVTAGPGLGFNRAVLFLPSERGDELVATMAIGPATVEEARETWTRLATERPSLGELLRRTDWRRRSGLSALVEGLTIPLAPARDAAAERTTNPLAEAYRAGQVRKLADAHTLDELPARFREAFAGTEVVCVPLPAKERAIGLLVADNAFNREPITEERIQLLELLARLAGLALDNARMYQQVQAQAEALQRALDELERTHERLLHNERLATVGAVIARVGHEIRNPLTTIGGFARTLGARPSDMERVARGAGIIVDEVEKLEVLLKEMLDFTSPHPPSLRPTDLNQVVASFAEVHRDGLTPHRVRLVLDLAPRLPEIHADARQLQRACLNLWRNAVQAMEEGPVDRERTLTIRTTRGDDDVCLVVEDSGPGIPEDVATRMFTPFFTTKHHGTGLGLAVVRKIVDDHGGAIEVRNGQRGGAAFRITLPIRRSAP